MTTLSGSAFLQALGWAIAGSLWQMALLWMIYQLCFGAWRSIRASIKTGAATIFQFVGFGWFISSLVGHYWKHLVSAAPVVVYDAAPVPGGPLGYVNEFLAWSERYLPYLSGAYLIVLVFLLARVFKAYRHVQAVRTEGLSRIEAKWRVYVTEMAHRIGIRREIRIWLSEKIDIPATMGYIKPIILLPIASFNHLSAEQVEAILLHELAHIKRHDYLLNLILTVMDTVLFFNPFAQLMAGHIRTERENSCDDFVLQFRYNPHVYASALLSLEQQRLSPELAMAASGKTDLLDRIKRIMNVPSRPMNYGQKLMALFITAGILASLAWLTPENVGNKPILKTMAALLPEAPVPDAPAPVVAPEPTFVPDVPVKSPKVRSSKPCPVKDEVREDHDVVLNFQSDTVVKLKTFKFKVDSMHFTFAMGQKAFEQGKKEMLQVQLDARQDLLDSYKCQIQQLENQVMDSRDKERAIQALRLSAEKVLRFQKAEQDQMARRQASASRQWALVVRDRELSDAEAARKHQLVQSAAEREQQLAVVLAEREQHLAEAEIQRERDRAAAILHDVNRKLAAGAFNYKIKSKVLDQQADDEENGISADQPGWQSPAYPTRSVIMTPVAYYPQTPRVKPMPALSAKTYKEKSTFYRISADRYAAAPVVTADRSLVRKLESDGYLNESCNVRIVIENNTLTINGQTQPESVYDQYKAYLDGKTLVILSSGKVIQVTEK